MEVLDREEIYGGLKIFLSREIEEKNKKKKDLLDEREKLETEKNKKRKILFQTDESGERRKMFSPLNTIFYPSQSENFQDRKMKNLNYRIEDLDKQMETIEFESDEIQRYLDSLEDFMKKKEQKQERYESQEVQEKKETRKIQDNQENPESQEIEKLEGIQKVQDHRECGVSSLEQEIGISEPDILISPVLAKTLESLKQFIQKKYEKVEILYDIEDSEVETDISLNEYIVELLQNLIELSVGKMNANVFLIEVKNKKMLRVEVDILANKEKIDHCTFSIES